MRLFRKIKERFNSEFSAKKGPKTHYYTTLSLIQSGQEFSRLLNLTPVILWNSHTSQPSTIEQNLLVVLTVSMKDSEEFKSGLFNASSLSAQLLLDADVALSYYDDLYKSRFLFEHIGFVIKNHSDEDIQKIIKKLMKLEN